MNCQQIQNIWDDYRDGQLTDSPRYSFERHLRGCPHCAELWAFETQWIEKLGSDEAELEAQEQAAAGPLFAMAVVEQWQKENRGRFWMARARWLGIAASIAVVLITGAMLALPRQAGRNREPVVAAVPSVAVLPDDPLGLLVMQLSENIERQPAQVREAISEAASMFTLDRLIDVIERTQPQKIKDQ